MFEEEEKRRGEGLTIQMIVACINHYQTPQEPGQKKGEGRGGVAGSAPKRASSQARHPPVEWISFGLFTSFYTTLAIRESKQEFDQFWQTYFFRKEFSKKWSISHTLILKNNIFEPRSPGTLLGTPQNLNLLILRWAPLNATSNQIVATYEPLSKWKTVGHKFYAATPPGAKSWHY